MSARRTFLATRAPASRHTLASARSRGMARECTPLSDHQAHQAAGGKCRPAAQVGAAGTTGEGGEHGNAHEECDVAPHPGVPSAAHGATRSGTRRWWSMLSVAAAARMAGGARWALTRTSWRTKLRAASFHRPPTPEPRTTSVCLAHTSSGYAAYLRRSATRSAAPSMVTVHGCGCPVRVSRDTSMAFRSTTRRRGVAPYTTRSSLLWSSAPTFGAVVCASHCSRTQACSTIYARLASRPVRGHASA